MRIILAMLTIAVIITWNVSFANDIIVKAHGDYNIDTMTYSLTWPGENKIVLQSSEFIPQKHKLEKCDDGVGNISVCKVDGYEVYGTDLDTPTYQLISAYYINKGVNVKLDISGMFNPWSGIPDDTDFIIIQKKDGLLFIKGIFSDGAGAYFVMWEIKGNASKRVVITKDESLLVKHFYED